MLDVFVILWFWVQFLTMNCYPYMIYDLEFWNYYDASMSLKELTDIICAIKLGCLDDPKGIDGYYLSH